MQEEDEMNTQPGCWVWLCRRHGAGGGQGVPWRLETCYNILISLQKAGLALKKALKGVGVLVGVFKPTFCIKPALPSCVGSHLIFTHSSNLLTATAAAAALQGDLSAVPDKFDTLRRADAHGLFEIDRKAFSFFRRKGPFDPDFLQLLSHVILGTILSKIVPFLYGKKPKLLELGSAPYGQILQAVQRDSAAAAVLAVAGLLALVAKFALKLW